MAGRRRTILLVIATGIPILAVVTIGVYGLVRGPAPTAPHPSSASAGPDAPTPGPSRAGLELGRDPLAAARTFARYLYGWDTRDTTRARLLDDLEAVAAAGGVDANGYAQDLAAYLPADTVWDQLNSLDARQTLTIATAEVPDSWAGIVRQNALPEGVSAVTITGTRTRVGDWYGQPVRSQNPVALTVFLSCPPATVDRCGVLRLSVEGKTLP